MDSTAPSIKLEHADARGEIYSIALPDNRELMLIHSAPGAFRGGHSHDCHEVVTLLSGKMRYHKLTQVATIGPGDSSFNRRGEIHMGEFLEDTWLVEYKLAQKDAWTQTDYEPMRERVRASQR